MHQHSRGLVHSEKAFIFIKDGKRQWLRLKALRPLLQHDAHPVAGHDRRIGMRGRVVYKQRVLPFEPLDQSGRQAEFPPQERQQLCLPRGRLFQNHAHRLLRRYYTVPRHSAQVLRHYPSGCRPE